MGGDRVFYGAGHGAQRGLVKDDFDALAGLLAGFQVSDIAFDESEVLRRLLTYRVQNIVYVMLVTRGKVIQADYFLVWARRNSTRFEPMKPALPVTSQDFWVVFRVFSILSNWVIFLDGGCDLLIHPTSSIHLVTAYGGLWR